MTVEEAIRRSGTVNILAKGSTKKAQSLIEEDENILYAMNTNLSITDNKKTILNNRKGTFSLKNLLNGVIVVTDKRVMFCSSSIGNTNFKQIAIKDIVSIDESINGLTKMGQFRIQAVTETFVINIYRKNIVEDLKASIYKAQSITQSSNQQLTNKMSNADEILKYKKLLDEGIITQEEFEKKKQELLK